MIARALPLTRTLRQRIDYITSPYRNAAPRCSFFLQPNSTLPRDTRARGIERHAERIVGVQLFDLGSCNVETSRFRCNMDARKRYDWGISASTFLLTSALTRKTEVGDVVCSFGCAPLYLMKTFV